MSRLGRAIADPTRCRILLAMVAGPAYPAQLADTLDLTRPNVSNHLTFLRGSGLVSATPEGRQVRYDLASPHLAHALVEFLAVVNEGAGQAGCAESGVREILDVRDHADEQAPAFARAARPHESLPASGHEPPRTQESGPVRAHRRPPRSPRPDRRRPHGEGAG
ncbi:DNA-binding transcriptional regulator, ArsR family [Actinopolymorpha singaporensis]|uniref:DNA-binding transcriptional regulator, ArsR family n=1 Tax=Actinopolymorpha singaporensis TaxID=117157 RepID=A0A1H1M848_9ACTN|nr:DNA-binding transcriptional regulator, ArsR family [Actinopolymorpha singaporensis]